MNLIEQLGGYNKAKEMYIAQLKAGLAPYGYEEALLEYRRANNIFEVGDYILTNDDASDGKVYEIEKNHFNEHFKIRSKDGFRYCRIWRIERHATEEEIKVGRRV